MSTGFQAKVILNNNHSGVPGNTEQTLQWLQKTIPMIMQTEKMRTDEFSLVPLDHVVICLN